MKELISSLNWRQIVIYLAATLLVVTGITQLSFLTDIEFTDGVARHGGDFIKTDVGNDGERLSAWFFWIQLSKPIGFLVSVIIMILLTRKAKYQWTNALIVIFMGVLIIRVGLLNQPSVKAVTLFIGGLFSQLGSFYPNLINGLFLTGLGLFIFYNKWTDRLILRVR